MRDQKLLQLTSNIDFADPEPDGPESLVGRIAVQLQDQTVHKITALSILRRDIAVIISMRLMFRTNTTGL